jgi:predicted DNA-binding transcriptional regulator AlpA
MTDWTFRLNLAGVDIDDDAQMDALYEAGCGDGSLGTDADGTYVVFHRAAPTPESAVLSAIRDVESIGGGARVTHVQNDDEWVTAAEIAHRTGRSRQSVHQLIHSDRGPGGFPDPVSRRGARNPLWSWEEVRAWFAAHDPGSVSAQPEQPSGNFLAAVNDRLDLRERLLQAPDAPWWSELNAVLPLAG